MASTPPPSEQPKPATKRTIDYTKSPTKSAAGERFADVLKTIVWVIPLTVLIWFYAEREQATEVPNVTIPIAVRINTPGKIVTLNDPADGKIVATLAGPRNAVGDLIDRFNKSTLVVTRTLDASTQRGPIQIPASALGDDPNFVKAGVTIRAATPQALLMNVDDLVTEEVAVRPPANVGNLVGNMLFSPSTVRVTAPRSLLELALRLEAPADGKLFVTADTSKVDVTTAGTHDQPGVGVHLERLTDRNLKIEPSSVSASFVVAPKFEEFIARNVPIWPTGPEAFLRNNEVEIQGSKSLASVKIEGPHEALIAFQEKYKKGTLRPPFVALVDLDSTDRGDVTNKPLTFRLSDGLHVDPATVPTVSLRVTPRNP